MRLLFTLLLFALSTTTYAQDKDKKTLDQQFEMKKYYMVFLKKGPNQDTAKAKNAELMKAHLAHLTKMYEEGKMSLAGPLLIDHDIRGICVYHIDDMAEVRRLAESDPAVQAGRFVVEVLPWYSAKGMILK
jgi:uncharacterized protein YciI